MQRDFCLRRIAASMKKRFACILYFYYYGIIELKLTVMNTKSVVAALAALAQDSRLAVFRLLVQAGPEGMAATKISERVGVPPSSLSFHLKEMAHAGLVIARQEGRFVIYTANFATMNGLVQFLTDNCCGGNSCDSVCTTECVTTEGAPS